MLNRIRREQPDLWKRIWLMPDGLRAAMDADAHPRAGSTIALVSDGDEKRGYAATSDGEAVELSNAELIRSLECEPDTPAVPLPRDTNVRVQTAVAALNEALSPKPVELEPRRRDDRITRYVNSRLGQLRLDDEADPEYLRNVERLRTAFNADLSVSVNNRIAAMMRAGLDGQRLVAELAALESELPKPKPEDEDEGPPPPTGKARAICSMGLILE